MSSPPAKVELRGVDAGYGKKRVLCGVDVVADAGKITAIIGPNGAGKSTVLRVAHGLLEPWKGAVVFDGVALGGATSAQRVQRGMSFCPQGNRVFAELTVLENLELGDSLRPPSEVSARVAAILESFPQLLPYLHRHAGSLSGGEQQMVSIARALVSQPRVLMLDEPSLGLAPAVLAGMFERIVEINRTQGVTIVLVEQKVRTALAIAHLVYALKLGRVSFSGPPGDLTGDPGLLRRLFL